jgi:flagellar biogenesis protein FliO
VNDQRKKVATLLVALVVGGGLVGLAAHSTGQEKADAPPSQADASFLTDHDLSNPTGAGLGSGELFSKMIFSVALVAVLAVAAFYVSKKVLPKVTNTPNKEIHVMALHVVQVGNRKLLIGSTNETIATLAHLDDVWLDLSKQETDSMVNL